MKEMKRNTQGKTFFISVTQPCVKTDRLLLRNKNVQNLNRHLSWSPKSTISRQDSETDRTLLSLSFIDCNLQAFDTQIAWTFAAFYQYYFRVWSFRQAHLNPPVLSQCVNTPTSSWRPKCRQTFLNSGEDTSVSFWLEHFLTGQIASGRILLHLVGI